MSDAAVRTSAGSAPPGIDHRPGLLSPEEAAALRIRLLAELDWSSPEVRVFGRRHPVPRRLAFVAPTGLRYAYSGLAHVGAGVPAWLEPVLARVRELTGEPFDSILATHYRDGRDRLGWHADAEPALGVDPPVAIVSLGASRTLAFRRTDPSLRGDGGRWRVELGDGDGLFMAPGVQRGWQHSVPPRVRAGERVSLGLRVLAPRDARS